MLTFDGALAGLLVLGIGLIGVVLAKPKLLKRQAGRALALFAFVFVPVVALWAGTVTQLERSKTTDFCLSCHVMEPYGESLHLEGAGYLPASHYQNHRVRQKTACFDCHTSYAMYGDIEAKLKGVQHLLVNYFGTIPEELALYEPYANRDCLHCHQEARTFLENDLHTDDLQALISNEVSCLDCHSEVHATSELDRLPRWYAGDSLEAALGGAP